MGSFDDFIRYGLPGYIFIATAIAVSFFSHILIIDLEVFKNFANIIGATILIVGPIVGFLIHQIYFIYFDAVESYNKLTRGCIKHIYDSFFHSDVYDANYSEKIIKKNCFIAWKFLSTNFEKDFTVEPLFLSRLRNVRNYSHAFGAIITACITSLFVMFAVAIYISFWPMSFWTILAVHLVVMMIFQMKRSELLARIDEMEIGIVLMNSDRFVEYVHRLITIKEKKTTKIKTEVKDTNVNLKLKEIISHYNSFSIAIENDTKLVDDIGIDSITILELIVDVENTFNIQVEQEDIVEINFTTFENLVNFIQLKIKKNA